MQEEEVELHLAALLAQVVLVVEEMLVLVALSPQHVTEILIVVEVEAVVGPLQVLLVEQVESEVQVL
jgi:hypothetical protein